jgi:hypothetical protein
VFPVALAIKLALTLGFYGFLFAHSEIEGISSDLKRLVDGTMALVYRRGLLDGFLVGFVVVFILMYRRNQCRTGN